MLRISQDDWDKIRSVLCTGQLVLADTLALLDLDPRNDFKSLNLQRTNWRGCELVGFDFSGSDLSGSDLSNANLFGTNLSGSNLSGSDLRGTDLSHALGLDKAILNDVKTDGATRWSSPANGIHANSPDEIARVVSALTYGETMELAEGMWRENPDAAVTESDFPWLLYRWSRVLLEKTSGGQTGAITPSGLPAAPDLYQSNDAETLKSIRDSTPLFRRAGDPADLGHNINLRRLQELLDRDLLEEIATEMRTFTYRELTELAEAIWKVKPKGTAVTVSEFPGLLHRWSQAYLEQERMGHTGADDIADNNIYVSPPSIMPGAPEPPDLYQSNDAETFKSVRHSPMAEDEPSDEFWTEPRKEGPRRSIWLARMIARLRGR